VKVKKFRSHSGLEILVGQDDVSNEQLSLRVAHPNDLWFHVNGFPGSHVVLRCGESGLEPDKASIMEAAGLAGWFSKMRHASTVAIHYCLAKQVSKPPRSKPGTVTIGRARKVVVRPSLLDTDP